MVAEGSSPSSEDAKRTPLVWALTGVHDGDNAQVLALAEELGFGFVEKNLSYNRLHNLSGRLIHKSLSSLTPSAKMLIVPPWPDLVIAIGRRSVPIARWVQMQNGGRTRIVLVGNPKDDPLLFDLVFTTRQYPVPQTPNVRVLPVAMSRFRAVPDRTDAENALLDAIPRPHLLLALGGPTTHFVQPPDHLEQMTAQLCRRAAALGGTVIAVPSRRTTDEMLAAVEAAFAANGHGALVDGKMPRFAVLMDDADEIFPTADSVSMISEALITGKPVGLVPGVQTRYSRLLIGSSEGSAGRFRDLRRFWGHLQSVGKLGTIEHPIASDTPNPVIDAAREVRALLGTAAKTGDSAPALV